MSRRSPYSPELRERAVLMVREVRPNYEHESQAIKAVAGKLGIGSGETLRTWVRASENDGKNGAGVPVDGAAELSAAGDLGRALESSQLCAKIFRRGHDQRLELVDRGGRSQNGPLASGQQDSEGFAFSALAGLDGVLGGEGLAGRADGVEPVGLASAPGSGTLGSADLNDALTSVFEESRQAGSVAADAFQRPAAPSPARYRVRDYEFR